MKNKKVPYTGITRWKTPFSDISGRSLISAS